MYIKTFILELLITVIGGHLQENTISGLLLQKCMFNSMFYLNFFVINHWQRAWLTSDLTNPNAKSTILPANKSDGRVD